MLSVLKKEKNIISQDHPRQLVALTTFLHKASFSMVLACFGIWTRVLERRVKNSYSDPFNASLVTFPTWAVSKGAYMNHRNPLSVLDRQIYPLMETAGRDTPLRILL